MTNESTIRGPGDKVVIDNGSHTHDVVVHCHTCLYKFL